MGWFGHNPWDGDPPMDILGTLDDQRGACLSALLGFPLRRSFGPGSRKRMAALQKLADDWARQWHFSGAVKTGKDGRIVLADRFDQWSVVGVVCKVLNQGVMLDRRVVEWAQRATEEIWEDAEWCNSWKHPRVFRAAVRHFADQLASALERDTSSTIYGTIEPVPAPRIKRRPAGRSTRSRARSRP